VDSLTAAGLVHAQLREAADAHRALLELSAIEQQVVDWARKCSDSIVAGGLIFFAGNGGSFADAQHLAAELTGRMIRDRAPLAGVALGTNGSSMSAIANDYGYPMTFARELGALARPHSVVIALSTSGNSPNILELVDDAKRRGLPAMALTGSSGGLLSERCETIRVPSERTERVQEMHILVGHTLCLLIEAFLGVGSTESAD